MVLRSRWVNVCKMVPGTQYRHVSSFSSHVTRMHHCWREWLRNTWDRACLQPLSVLGKGVKAKETHANLFFLWLEVEFPVPPVIQHLRNYRKTYYACFLNKIICTPTSGNLKKALSELLFSSAFMQITMQITDVNWNAVLLLQTYFPSGQIEAHLGFTKLLVKSPLTLSLLWFIICYPGTHKHSLLATISF